MTLRNPNVVTELREKLRKAAEEHAHKEKPPKTKADAIRAVREEIAQLRHQGLTWDEVAKEFEATLDASAATIRLAIGAKGTARKKSVAQSQEKRRVSVEKQSAQAQSKERPADAAASAKANKSPALPSSNPDDFAGIRRQGRRL